MVTTGGAPRATIFGHLKGVRVEYCRYDSDRCRIYLFQCHSKFPLSTCLCIAATKPHNSTMGRLYGKSMATGMATGIVMDNSLNSAIVSFICLIVSTFASVYD